MTQSHACIPQPDLTTLLVNRNRQRLIEADFLGRIEVLCGHVQAKTEMAALGHCLK